MTKIEQNSTLVARRSLKSVSDKFHDSERPETWVKYPDWLYI